MFLSKMLCHNSLVQDLDEEVYESRGLCTLHYTHGSVTPGLELWCIHDVTMHARFPVARLTHRSSREDWTCRTFHNTHMQRPDVHKTLRASRCQERCFSTKGQMSDDPWMTFDHQKLLGFLLCLTLFILEMKKKEVMIWFQPFLNFLKLALLKFTCKTSIIHQFAQLFPI